ncbi:MAG: M48 family metalloprotease, partial [Bdellovibrionota bacterium]
RRHSFRALVKTLGSTAGFAILGLFTGMDAAAWIYKGTEIAGLKYSREQESEADRIGAEMLNSSGVGVAGLIAFFERKPKDSLGIEKHMAFLSTHPLSEERVATLKVLGSMPKSNENLTPRSFDELKKSL